MYGRPTARGWARQDVRAAGRGSVRRGPRRVRRNRARLPSGREGRLGSFTTALAHTPPRPSPGPHSRDRPPLIRAVPAVRAACAVGSHTGAWTDSSTGKHGNHGKPLEKGKPFRSGFLRGFLRGFLSRSPSGFLSGFLLGFLSSFPSGGVRCRPFGFRREPGRQGVAGVSGRRRRLGATGHMSAAAPPGSFWGARVSAVCPRAARRPAAVPSGPGRRRPARAGSRPAGRPPRRRAGPRRRCGRRP